MWVGIEEIQCFQAVMRLGSINAASQELNKAKSAVSYSINKLEDQLGFMLFQRGSYRLEPTRRGQEFFEKSHKLIEEAQRLETFAEQMKSGVELKFSLSATELFPLHSVNKVLKGVLDTYPTTELRFQREVLSGEKMLSSGQVDLAIFEAKTKNENFEYKKIDEIQMRLVAAADHPFFSLKEEDRTIDALIKHPQIIQRSTIPSDFSAGVYSDTIKWFVTDIYTKKELIADGLGWGRLPVHETKDLVRENKLRFIEGLEETEHLSIYLVRRKANSHGEVSKYIWDLAKG